MNEKHKNGYFLYIQIVNSFCGIERDTRLYLCEVIFIYLIGQDSGAWVHVDHYHV